MDFKEHYITETVPAEEPANKYRRTIGVCRIALLVLIVLCLALLIALIVVSAKYHEQSQYNPDYSCPERLQQIDLDPPEVLPPFFDLTPEEISEIKDYLYRQQELNLVRPPALHTNSSYIFTIDLKIPNKDVTLNYLDNGKAQPQREAKVVIFRGDKPENYVEEYTVGPLPFPVYKKDLRTYPFRYRPYTVPEIVDAISFVSLRVHQTVSHILEESYGGKLLECGDKCLKFQQITPVSTTYSGDPRTRKIWCWLSYDVEYKFLNNLDFQVLIDITGNRKDEYKIEKVLYAGESFDTLEQLSTSYEYPGMPKTKIPYPIRDENLFSSAHRRGILFPDENLSPPEQFEPSGHRYSIKGRHISYMGWDFDVRMSPVSGPQIFDIRYRDERIVYELSLQDIAVFYSAGNPASRTLDVSDTLAMIGQKARALVPGYDCPRYATMLTTDFMHEYVDDFTLKSTFCVFEHNTGMPLRRHISPESGGAQFYEGMVDTVLTLRTIMTIANYDYIYDLIFHQNGAAEVKVTPTGYLITSFWNKREEEYSFRLRDHVAGTLHYHMFHFKVDMDIHGRDNRFETLDIVPVEVDNTKWSKTPNARYAQTKIVRKQIQTEREAAIKYDFDQPKYLTFYSNKFKSEYGVPKAYRLLVKGNGKQLYAENKGQEPSFSWSRYQVAVTKYKESEKRSSSMYASFDGEDPVVNFQKFIDDNEVISDEDQVTWVSMGLHHIPHTEDLPVTTTVGLGLQFFLLPYNYFPEDPAMGSGDSTRIEPRVPGDINKGLMFERYARSSNSQCIPREKKIEGKTFYQWLNAYPWLLFNP